jgi:hypothetical protein
MPTSSWADPFTVTEVEWIDRSAFGDVITVVGEVLSVGVADAVEVGAVEGDGLAGGADDDDVLGGVADAVGLVVGDGAGVGAGLEVVVDVPGRSRNAASCAPTVSELTGDGSPEAFRWTTS